MRAWESWRSYGDRVAKRRGGVTVLFLVSNFLFLLLVFWRLALTDLVIGRGDIFFYFYPYRDFASAAVRAGRVPLWNPYLFMGAPFLANSQAGFFYPLNLALAWLPVERMVNASILIHAALALAGAYLWGRAGLGLGRWGAWLTGLCYGLGGYFVAQVEHLNQVQVLAWLPWLLWVKDGHLRLRAVQVGRRTALRDESGPGGKVAGLAVVIALQLLAGHTQSVFICLVGLAVYALLPSAWDWARRRTRHGPGTGWRGLVRPFCVVVGAALWGAALAAVQLLPTFELSQSSMRSGGLPFKEAVSFSLRPGLVGRALLPSWGAPLFPELVAHVGVVALGLAAVGVVSCLGGASTEPRGRARRGALWLAAWGLFLALGGFNPVYFLLVKLVPGFALFRAPARWLALYALGVAGLVGLGLDRLVDAAGERLNRRHWQVTWGVAGGALAGGVLLGQLLGESRANPDLAPPLGAGSVVGWLAAALLFGLVWRFWRSSRLLPALLVVLVGVELLGASFFLPFNRATAPGALTSLRPAVAHLLAEAAQSGTDDPAGAARFLSISDIFFDPGDKPEIEIALEPQLSDDALYDYLIATKQKEVLIPNLPLYYRLPTMDGYDGGVLPLRHYVTLERLYMPEAQVAMDGRLRENLKAVPDGRWLNLFNVRFVITDKVGDAWFDGVFYDLQMGASLRAGDEAVVGDVPALASTAVGVVYRADGAVEGTPLAELSLTMSDGRRVLLPLLADAASEGERVARLSLDAVGTPSALSVRGVWEAGVVAVRGLSLMDERTAAFQALVLSDSGHYRLAHSGDVKIYENLDVLPRVFFVSQATVVPDDEAALAVMRAPDFDPTAVVVLAGDTSAPALKGEPSSLAQTELLFYEPERVVATVIAPAEGWLLFSEAWYPGWEATVDGQPAPVERADILFRAVAVPAGEHRVELVYRPASLRWGAAISLGALLLLLLGRLRRLRSYVRGLLLT
jgi:hypothetical protein